MLEMILMEITSRLTDHLPSSHSRLKRTDLDVRVFIEEDWQPHCVYSDRRNIVRPCLPSFLEN